MFSSKGSLEQMRESNTFSTTLIVPLNMLLFWNGRPTPFVTPTKAFLLRRDHLCSLLLLRFSRYRYSSKKKWWLNSRSSNKMRPNFHVFDFMAHVSENIEVTWNLTATQIDRPALFISDYRYLGTTGVCNHVNTHEYCRFSPDNANWLLSAVWVSLRKCRVQPLYPFEADRPFHVGLRHARSSHQESTLPLNRMPTNNGRRLDWSLDFAWNDVCFTTPGLITSLCFPTVLLSFLDTVNFWTD